MDAAQFPFLGGPLVAGCHGCRGCHGVQEKCVHTQRCGCHGCKRNAYTHKGAGVTGAIQTHNTVCKGSELNRNRPSYVAGKHPPCTQMYMAPMTY